MYKTLTGHKQAQCRVEILSDGYRLISYSTVVAEFRSEVLEVFGLYSATTRKHIGWFLKEYVPGVSYQIAKKCAEKNLLYGWGAECGFVPKPQKVQ